MVTIAIALMFIAVIAVIAYPYFSPRDPDASFVSGGNTVVDNLGAQRDATYTAIKDLEFDHAMGKLSDGDYQSMRAKYEAKAVAILQELDNQTEHRAARPGGDEMIEREVQQLRRSTRCPKCSAPVTANDVFCGKCGTALRGPRCPNCGRRMTVGDKFCAGCGSALG